MRVDLDEVGSASVTVAGLAQGLESTLGQKNMETIYGVLVGLNDEFEVLNVDL